MSRLAELEARYSSREGPKVGLRVYKVSDSLRGGAGAVT